MCYSCSLVAADMWKGMGSEIRNPFNFNSFVHVNRDNKSPLAHRVMMRNKWHDACKMLSTGTVLTDANQCQCFNQRHTPSSQWLSLTVDSWEVTKTLILWQKEREVDSTCDLALISLEVYGVYKDYFNW